LKNNSLSLALCPKGFYKNYVEMAGKGTSFSKGNISLAE